MSLDLTVILLSFNESQHISRAIESIQSIAKRVVVVDSGSTDNTVTLAKQKGADIYINKWVNYATQFNYALSQTNITTKWVMRLDCDEYIDERLKHELSVLSNVSEEISGFQVNRRIKFLGRELIYGGMSNYWALRVWRHAKGKCEDKWMDEHIILSDGIIKSLNGKLVDDNLNSIGWWIDKHNSYSSREVVDIYFKISDEKTSLMAKGSKKIRTLKGIYLNSPILLRSIFYFMYRYFIRFGFMDGYPGFIWSFMQGWWYRTLVDVKLKQLKLYSNNDEKKALHYVRTVLKVNYEK